VGNIVFDWVRPRTLNARMIKRDMASDDLCGTAVFLASTPTRSSCSSYGAASRPVLSLQPRQQLHRIAALHRRKLVGRDNALAICTVERNGSSDPYSSEFGNSLRKPATPAGLNPMLASS
jgi:hypothetical protein